MSKKATASRFDVVKRNPDMSISISKVSGFAQSGSTHAKVAKTKNNAAKVKETIKYEVSGSQVTVDIPLRTKSEANCAEHWTVRQKRHKRQQAIVAIALKPVLQQIRLPCKLTLTRLAPHKLDKHDNLPMSFKYIVDAICSVITGNFVAGQADSDERIDISYDQIVSKEYGIRIIFS